MNATSPVSIDILSIITAATDIASVTLEKSLLWKIWNFRIFMNFPVFTGAPVVDLTQFNPFSTNFTKWSNIETAYRKKIIYFYSVHFIGLLVQQLLPLSFLSRLLSPTLMFHRTAREGGGCLFNSSLPLPSVSQTLKHQSGDHCRELTSLHS